MKCTTRLYSRNVFYSLFCSHLEFLKQSNTPLGVQVSRMKTAVFTPLHSELGL